MLINAQIQKYFNLYCFEEASTEVELLYAWAVVTCNTSY